MVASSPITATLPQPLQVTSDDAFTENVWALAMQYIVQRFSAVEAFEPSWQAAVDDLQAYGFSRLDDAFAPLYEQIANISSLGSVFSAFSSAPQLIKATGPVIFTIDDVSARQQFAFSTYMVAVSSDGVSTMSGLITAYDRTTGKLSMTVQAMTGINGGTSVNWTISPSLPPLATNLPVDGGNVDSAPGQKILLKRTLTGAVPAAASLSSGEFEVDTLNGILYWTDTAGILQNIPLKNVLNATGVTSQVNSIVTAQVNTAVAALVASAPGTLNTLNELATALGDDPAFATTMATNLGTKAAKGTNGDITSLTALTTATLSGTGQSATTFDTTGSMAGVLQLDGAGLASGTGGAVLFSAGTKAWKYAAIKGYATNGTGNTVGDIVVYTRINPTDATLTEVVRFKNTGGVSFSGNIPATSTTTGTVTVVGGVGIGGALYVGGGIASGSLALTTALPAASGGTGQATYVIGDVLYASTTSALSRLAAPITGNVLLSGGVGVAPAWGKVGLSIHISGTLAIGNGGTGATTAAGALTALGAASSGANSTITSLSGLTTPLSISQGGTAAVTAAAALASLGGAAKGANNDITSLAALSTPLSIAQGGTGVAAAPLMPTVTVLSASTGTYTTPTGCKWLKVRMVGAGGGGGGCGTGATAGGTGGNTTFGTSLLSAAGGGPGLANSGVSSVGGLASGGDINFQGCNGSGGQTGTAGNTLFGGPGGMSALFGGGGNVNAGTGGTGKAGTGGGGSGGSSIGAESGGAGGAAGGSLEKLISGPASTYAYAVGAGGVLGAIGTGGNAGGAGGSGTIIVEEHYGY